MLAVTGYNSAIVRQLAALIPEEQVQRIDHASYRNCLHADRYVLCAGVMVPTPGIEQHRVQVFTSMRVNYLEPMSICDAVFQVNPRARICVVGSESGFSGSYDHIYAAAKSALHRYVETKRLQPQQQLVPVGPTIIEDAGMTLRRRDPEVLDRKRQAHPKRRFLTAVEVARLIHFLLYVDDGYISGVTVRMNGGAHTVAS